MQQQTLAFGSPHDGRSRWTTVKEKKIDESLFRNKGWSYWEVEKPQFKSSPVKSGVRARLITFLLSPNFFFIRCLRGRVKLGADNVASLFRSGVITYPPHCQRQQELAHCRSRPITSSAPFYRSCAHICLCRTSSPSLDRKRPSRDKRSFPYQRCTREVY